MPSRHFPSIRELFLFVEACLLLAASSLAIRLLPFRVVVRTMHWKAAHSPDRAGQLANEAILAVRRASARLPWRTACFDQGLAAHWMIRRLGLPSILHYGIDPSGVELSAHVWVSLDGQILVGEEEAERHAEVTSFPARAGDAGGSLDAGLPPT